MSRSLLKGQVRAGDELARDPRRLDVKDLGVAFFTLKNIDVSTCSRDTMTAEYRPRVGSLEPSGITRFMPLMRSLDAKFFAC